MVEGGRNLESKIWGTSQGLKDPKVSKSWLKTTGFTALTNCSFTMSNQKEDEGESVSIYHYLETN